MHNEKNRFGDKIVGRPKFRLPALHVADSDVAAQNEADWLFSAKFQSVKAIEALNRIVFSLTPVRVRQKTAAGFFGA